MKAGHLLFTASASKVRLLKEGNDMKGDLKLIICSTLNNISMHVLKAFQPSYEQAKRGSCYQRAAMWIRCRPGNDGDSFSLQFFGGC